MALPFNRAEHRVLSRPHTVVFAGWQSDTYQLQRNGWQIAAREDYYGYEVALLLRHPETGLKMFTQSVKVDFVHRDPSVPLRFVVERASTDMLAVRREFPIDLGSIEDVPFRQIDAKPQYIHDFQPRSIEDFGIFAAQLVRTEEILIEPKSVAECMEYIKKLQAPELAAIRERNRQRDRDRASEEPVLRQTFHAQILTIAA